MPRRRTRRSNNVVRRRRPTQRANGPRRVRARTSVSANSAAAGVGVAIGTQWKPKVSVRKSADGVRVVGSEVVAYLKEYNGHDQLRLIPINPITWIDTKVQREARLYALYKPNALSLHYRPSVGTAADGNVVLGILPTGINPGTTSQHWLRQLVASSDCMVTSPYFPAMIRADCAGWEQPRFRLDSLTEEGTNPFYLAATFTNQDESITCGMLIVEYDFTFSKPSNPEYLPYTAMTYDTTLVLANGIEVGGNRSLGTLFIAENYTDLGDAKIVPGDRLVSVDDTANSPWQVIRGGVPMEELTSLSGTMYGILLVPTAEM